MENSCDDPDTKGLERLHNHRLPALAGFSGSIMKTILITAALCVAVGGCAPPRYQMKTACPGRTKSDVVSAMIALVAQEAFTVTLVNENVGIVQANGTSEFSVWTGYYSTPVWQMTMKGDTALLIAKILFHKENIFGAQTSSTEAYMTDEAAETHTWYWNVRRGMESLCGSTAIVVKLP